MAKDYADLALQLDEALNNAFTLSPLAELEEMPYLCDAVEEKTIDYIREHLLAYIEEKAKDLKVEHRYLGKDLFIYDSLLYKFSATEVGPYLRTLQIHLTVASEDKKLRKLHKCSLPVNEVARYTTIEIQVQGKLNRYVDNLLEQSRFLLERGAAWLREFSLRMLAQHQSSIATELYSIIRQGLSNELAGQIYLAAVENGRGAHILDQMARTEAIKRLGSSNITTGTSPLRLFNEFEVLTRDLDHMVAKVSVPQNQIVTVEQNTAPYANTGILEANLAVFRNKNLVVQPLVTSGNSWLLAMYSPENRTAIEPVLEKRRGIFTRIIQQQGQIFDKVSLAMKEKRRIALLQNWAALGGTFAGSFLNALFHK